MGIADKCGTMDEAGHWPAELRFHKMHRGRRGRNRDVSPVPSYYSEPVSLHQHKDVTVRLPPLIMGANQEDEDDEEDAQSMKSLPTVMSTLTFDPKVKRSRRLPKVQVISDLNLPPVLECNLMVKGTGCTIVRDFLPAIKSKGPRERKILERPPCRAGCRRPENPERVTRHMRHPQNPSVHQSWYPEGALNIKVSCRNLSLTSEEPQRPQLTSQNPPAQALTSGAKKEAPVRARPPQKPMQKNAPVSNGPVLECLQEECCFSCPRELHLLEAASGFEEHLRRQILNSPLPHRGAPPQSCLLLLQRGGALPPTQSPYGPTLERTVELCRSRGKRLPRITMTRPTPSPKHLRHTENRHMA